MLGGFIRAGDWWDLPRRVLRAVRKWRFFLFFFPILFVNVGLAWKALVVVISVGSLIVVQHWSDS